MEQRTIYKTEARQVPICANHPTASQAFVLTPDLMHYGKQVCTACNKFITWVGTPEGVSKPKPTFSLGGMTFDAKTRVSEYVKGVLSSTPFEQALTGVEFLVLRDLLNWHPDAEQKIGVGIERIEVRRNETHAKNARGFWLVRSDGSETDFSYLKCLQGERSHRIKFLAACRFAVKDHITLYRDEFFRVAPVPTCALTGVPITPENSHVDHTPPYTFERITQAFAMLNGLDMEDVSLTLGGMDGVLVPLFSSLTMRDNFVQFHNNHAALRVISAQANLSIVPKSVREMADGYRQ